MSTKPITLQDIALRLGISKVAVSKALRGHSDISKSTTEKVIALAAELDYRPNILARKLAARETRTIGLVVPKIAHHFLTQAIDSIYSTAYEEDYEIVMMVSEEDEQLEAKHIATLLSMRVDGLLISVTEQTQNREIFQRVADNGTPLVFFDRVIEDIGFSCITSADEDGATQLINFAIEKGYRRFGHIGGHQTVSIGRDRYLGFLNALESHELSVKPEDVVFGGFSRTDGYSAFTTMHSTGDLPEILFAVTYPVALGVLMASRDLAVRIPQDIDLLCFGGSNYNNLISPAITGIKQPAAQIGKMALEHLLLQIKQPDEEFDKRFTVPVELNIADTCIGPEHKEL
ncbi:LacI family DNA-binding transcriptional regulator [bacterium]|nr:LacI family DNA-binding transcriptional regulator [bacterium]